MVRWNNDHVLQNHYLHPPPRIHTVQGRWHEGSDTTTDRGEVDFDDR